MNLTDDLKSETREVHDHVEKESNIKNLMRDDLTINQYLTVFKFLANKIAPLEMSIKQHKDLPLMLGWGERVSYDALIKEAQLRDIAIDSKQKSVELHSREDLVAALYVLEGSSLGANLIFKHLTNIFGSKISQNMYYFKTQSSKDMKNWQRFKAHINQISSTGFDTHICIKKAQEVFQWIGG